jgi:predicted metal-dependent hydrolase
MTDWRPDWAYVPGRTPRHAEALFDPLKGIAEPLEASPAWRAGLVFFREGFFWEAHEVWEAVWLAAPPNGAERCLVRGLIQTANARLKQAMDRPQATVRLEAIAGAEIAEAFTRSGGAPVMGWSAEEVALLLANEHYNA